MASASPTHDRLTHRLGIAAVLCALPLVLFGGSVTTLGAGMAVEGWLIAEGRFLLFFPIESWLRDTATFVEHTHRLFGVLVGLVLAGACARAWAARGARAALLPGIAFLCVCVQGALGGFRVLADSADLAFLHGVFAQATLAVLALAAAAASGAWGAAERGFGQARGLARRASLATLVVLAQVALGAWYRHGLRPVPELGLDLRLGLHAAGAVATFAAVGGLAAACARAARELEEGGRASAAASLRRQGRALLVLLWVQVALGLAAWAGYRPGAIGPAEWGLSVLHVLGGALLLAQCVVTLGWARRLAPARGAAGLVLEGAR